jgi:FkbM family methyltransferase
MPSPLPLSPRQRLTWLAHFWKAATQQHHKEMRQVFGPILPQDGVVFDVGAHSGQFAKLFAQMVPNGHVYAFEPGSYALSLLRPILRLKRLANVTVQECGLGDAEQELVLNMPKKRSGSYGFGLSFMGDASGEARALVSETVRVRGIDDVVAELGLERLDLIKADIEGSEMRMLAGAEATLRRYRPALFLEVSDSTLRRQGDSIAGLTEFLKGLGYAPQGGWRDEPVRGDVLFVAAGALP